MKLSKSSLSAATGQRARRRSRKDWYMGEPAPRKVGGLLTQAARMALSHYFFSTKGGEMFKVSHRGNTIEFGRREKAMLQVRKLGNKYPREIISLETEKEVEKFTYVEGIVDQYQYNPKTAD